MSSLSKVIGKKKLAEIQKRQSNPMSLVASNVSTIRDKAMPERSVVIERETILGMLPMEERFEQIVERIANVNSARREMVENMLIATGSPKSIRKANQKALNSAVQNRLSENSDRGTLFRQYMTQLLANVYGKQIGKDGFFRTESSEKPFNKSGASGTFLNQQYSIDNLQRGTGALIPDGTMPPPPLAKTSDGGVETTQSQQDWGSILQGGASLVNSIGGVIGMFTNGGNSNSNDNVFNPYTQPNAQNYCDMYPDAEQCKKKSNSWIIWLIVGAVVITGVVLVVRNMKND